ncbi:MAG: hypothetical protein FD172_3032 [Methylocystaceae bacterium]|nr:MAG: hypothetical protein FD172_3032 [Methylocystaceae bacterium]
MKLEVAQMPIQKRNEDKPKGSRPVYHARAKQSPDNEFMTTIGAAWRFNDGDGLVVRLNFLPLDGQFILVPPKERDE